MNFGYVRLVLTKATPAQAALVGALAVKLTADHPDDDVRYDGHVLELSNAGEELVCEAALWVEAGTAAACRAIPAWLSLVDGVTSHRPPAA